MGKNKFMPQDQPSFDKGGTINTERMRYQYAIAANFALAILRDSHSSELRKIKYLYCEHHDDILGIYENDQPLAIQVKTKEDGSLFGPTDKPIKDAILNFTSRLRKEFPNDEWNFVLALNVGLKKSGKSAFIGKTLENIVELAKGSFQGEEKPVISTLNHALKSYIEELAKDPKYSVSLEDILYVLSNLNVITPEKDRGGLLSSAPNLATKVILLSNAIKEVLKEKNPRYDSDSERLEKAALALIDRMTQAGESQERLPLDQIIAAINPIDLAKKKGIAGKLITPAIIEETIENHLYRRKPLISPEHVFQAASLISESTRAQIIRGQKVIPRPNLVQTLVQSIISPSRYCILIGPSNTGKSVTLAMSTEVFRQMGWAMILLPARGFSFSSFIIRLNFTLRGTTIINTSGVGWLAFFEPWEQKLAEGPNGLILALDGIDEIDPKDLMSELSEIDSALIQLKIPVNKVKIILSCYYIAWNRIKLQLPFLNEKIITEINQPQRMAGEGILQQSDISWIKQSEDDLYFIEIEDFNDIELNQALQLIEATELISPALYDRRVDPYIDGLRQLLKHPPTFSIYAELRAQEGGSGLNNLTWSSLVKKYVDDRLKKAFNLCKVRPNFLREQLTALVSFMRKQHLRTFTINIKEIPSDIFPKEQIETENLEVSRYAALRETGILVESPKEDENLFVSFSKGDIGAYLLSFSLEEELKSKSVKELVKDWFTEAFEFTPLLDAILALVNRLADKPNNPNIEQLVAAIVELDSLINFQNHFLFHQMPPSVLQVLFNLLSNGVSEFSLGAYRKAARAIRPSPVNWPIITLYLTDNKPELLEFAAEIAGIQGSKDSIPELINLLGADWTINHRAYAALRILGESALSHLLGVIKDQNQPLPKKIDCLQALATLGIRNQEVETVLTDCLKKDQENKDGLFRPAMRAAANLRDLSQIEFAKQALSSIDAETTSYASKLLIEVPEKVEVNELVRVINYWHEKLWKEEENSFWISEAMVNLLAILDKQGTEEANQVIATVVSNELKGTEADRLINPIRFINRHEGPGAFSVILNYFIQSVKSGQVTKSLGSILDLLSKIRQPEKLAILEQTIKNLEIEGFDVAEFLLPTTVNEIQSKLPDADSENYFNVYLDSMGVQNVLSFLIVSRAENFAIVAAGLLKYGWYGINHEIYELLWVAGDKAAEVELLKRFDLVQSNQAEGSQNNFSAEKNEIIKALGTSGAESSIQAILNFLRSDELTTTDLAFEGLYPLALREIVKPEQLIEIVKDEKILNISRARCLSTLGLLDATRYMDLFIEIIEQSHDPELQGLSIRFLGVSTNSRVVAIIRNQLRNTDSSFVASEATQSLMRLNVKDAATDLENAFDKFGNTQHAFLIIDALANLKPPSSLNYLIKKYEDGRYIDLKDKILESLGAFLPDIRALEILLFRLENGRSSIFGRGSQIPAIDALAKHDPTLLIEKVLVLLETNSLEAKARTRLAKWLPELTKVQKIDEKTLRRFVKELIIDRHFPAHLLALISLQTLEINMCQEIYDELNNSDNLWLKACSVHMLGFVELPIEYINEARFDVNPLIRRYGDQVLGWRKKRNMVTPLIKEFVSSQSSARLASYFVLGKFADKEVISSLESMVKKDNLSYIFLYRLEQNIMKASKENQEKYIKEELEYLRSLGVSGFGEF